MRTLPDPFSPQLLNALRLVAKVGAKPYPRVQSISYRKAEAFRDAGEEAERVLKLYGFAPDKEWCSESREADGEHCQCWSDCDPCCWCGDDTRDVNCDCPKCIAARRCPHPELLR